MHVHDRFDDEEADAGAAFVLGPRFVRLVKALENMLLIRLRNTASAVLNIQLNSGIILRSGHRNVSAGRCKFDRVVHEVVDRLIEQGLVAVDRDQRQALQAQHVDPFLAERILKVTKTRTTISDKSSG